MSFSLNLANFSPEQAAFGYSAAHETLLALHVFYDCKHHPLHIPWVINARKKISPGLKEQIEQLSFFYQRPLITFWDLQEDSTIRTFEEELNQLAKMPVHLYHEKIVALLPQSKEEVFERYPKSTGALERFFNNPNESKEQFFSLIEAFWESCLQEEWPRIEELLLKDISYRGRILQNKGILSLLDSLSPDISVDTNRQRAIIRRVSKTEIEFEENNRIFFAPSYFIWPHLFVKRDMPFGINYSIQENQFDAKRPIPPANLTKFLRAAGEITRLQIIKYIAHNPRSTRELAGLIGVTEGAVSKHLKQLQDAGIVSATRESYYVFYQLNKESFTEFTQGLYTFIDK